MRGGALRGLGNTTHAYRVLGGGCNSVPGRSQGLRSQSDGYFNGKMDLLGRAPSLIVELVDCFTEKVALLGRRTSNMEFSGRRLKRSSTFFA